MGVEDFVVSGNINQAVTYSSTIKADCGGDYDAVFVRFASAHEARWADSWGIGGLDATYSTAFAPGAVWVGGAAKGGDIGKGLTSGGNKGWSAKLVPQGSGMTALLKEQASDAAETFCTALAPTPDGGVIYVAKSATRRAPTPISGS